MSKYKTYINYNKKQLKNKSLFIDDNGNVNPLFILLFLIIVIFGTLIYFINNPYYERISCDENLYCTVEHKYYEDFGYSEHFNVSPESYLELKLGNYCYFHSVSSKFKFYKGKDVKHLYLKIFDGRKMKSPFKCYIDTIYINHPEYNKNNKEVEKSKFANYINNPSVGYIYENYIDIFDIFLFAFLMIALALPIMFIIEFIYEKFNK